MPRVEAAVHTIEAELANVQDEAKQKDLIDRLQAALDDIACSDPNFIENHREAEKAELRRRRALSEAHTKYIASMPTGEHGPHETIKFHLAAIGRFIRHEHEHPEAVKELSRLSDFAAAYNCSEVTAIFAPGTVAERLLKDLKLIRDGAEWTYNSHIPLDKKTEKQKAQDGRLNEYHQNIGLAATLIADLVRKADEAPLPDPQSPKRNPRKPDRPPLKPSKAAKPAPSTDDEDADIAANLATFRSRPKMPEPAP